MKYFTIADAHLGHLKMIQYENRSPNFNEIIVKRWNSTVNDDDTVIVVGDYCLTGKDDFRNYTNALKGKKILIKGNHDNMSDGFYMSNGFMFVCDSLILDKWTKRIMFSHLPRTITEYNEINIHGHIHSKKLGEIEKYSHLDEKKHICVSVEQINYTPILIEKLVCTKQ